jgi:hypothetical protein
MLLATTAISMSTTQNALAGKYGKNQATSQANACGNDFMPLNIGCQNTGSQIQGDENSVALAAQQTFPEAVTPIPPDNGPTPEPEPETCEECFTQLLGAEVVAELEVALSVFTAGQISTVEQLCTALANLPTADLAAALEGPLRQILVSIGVEASVIAEVIDCVLRILGA